MIMYRVFVGEDMKRSFECKCGKCTQFQKDTWHCLSRIFTRDLDEAINEMCDGDVLVRYEYATHDFKGSKITARVKYEDLPTTVLL